MTYTEPTWTNASDQFVQRVSAFTELLTPFSLISAQIIRYLQLHFSSADNIQNEGIKGLVWSDDPKLSKLYIGSGQADNVRNASQKAALFINRDEVKPVDLYIPSSTLKVGINTAPSDNDLEHRMINGVTIVRCDSKSASEVELLSEEVYNAILFLLPSLSDDSLFQSMDVQLAKTGKLESGSFAAAVTITWTTYVCYSNVSEDPY